MLKVQNLNDLVREISKREGGAQNLSIAQIKEVMRHEWDIISEIYESLGGEKKVEHLFDRQWDAVRRRKRKKK